MPDPVRPVPPSPRALAEACEQLAAFERSLPAYPSLGADLAQALHTVLAATAPVEPSGDLVEWCVDLALEAEIALGKDPVRRTWDARVIMAEGIRAVLAHLAALGMGEVLLSVDDIRKDWPTDGLPEDGPGGWEGIMLLVVPIVRARLAAILTAMAERVRAVEAERDEARAWVRRLTASERVLTCVYCGEAYPPGSPTHGAEVLTAHVRVCTKHPMREAEAKLARVEAITEEDVVVAMNEDRPGGAFGRIEDLAPYVLRLIRSRIAGAEAPAGGTT